MARSVLATSKRRRYAASEIASCVERHSFRSPSEARLRACAVTLPRRIELPDRNAAPGARVPKVMGLPRLTILVAFTRAREVFTI